MNVCYGIFLPQVNENSSSAIKFFQIASAEKILVLLLAQIILNEKLFKMHVFVGGGMDFHRKSFELHGEGRSLTDCV